MPIKIIKDPEKEKNLPPDTIKVCHMFDKIMSENDKAEKPPIVVLFIQDHKDNLLIKGNVPEHVAVMTAVNVVKIHRGSNDDIVFEACVDMLKGIGVDIQVNIDEKKINGPIGHA